MTKTKKEKQIERQENLKAVSKVNNVWEFFAFLAVVKNNVFWIIVSTVSITINIALIAKYTTVFSIIFKFVIGLFSGGQK